MRSDAVRIARSASIVALVATCLAPRLALAAETDEARPSGVRLGIQSGFALPIGRTFSNSGALDETIAGVVPMRADLGVRIAGHLYVGGLFEWGIVVPNACNEGTQCAGTRLRLGAAAAYHFLPASTVDPWIGVALTYERLSMSRAISSRAMDVGAAGIDLPGPELGVDLRPTSWLRVGPVVSGAMGRYTSLTFDGITTRDFDPAWHAWVDVGLRTMVDF